VTKVLHAPSRASRSGVSGFPMFRRGRPVRPRSWLSVVDVEVERRRRQESVRLWTIFCGGSAGGGECGMICSESKRVDSRTQCFIASSRREALNSVLPYGIPRSVLSVINTKRVSET